VANYLQTNWGNFFTFSITILISSPLILNNETRTLIQPQYREIELSLDESKLEKLTLSNLIFFYHAKRLNSINKNSAH